MGGFARASRFRRPCDRLGDRPLCRRRWLARAAIDAALRAFRDTPWRRDAALRARVLDELAAAFERHAGALIELLALENGKIKPEAHFEVSMVPSKLRYYAALARAETGRSGTPRPDVLSLVLREPMGVAGIIVPWNSPSC